MTPRGLAMVCSTVAAVLAATAACAGGPGAAESCTTLAETVTARAGQVWEAIQVELEMELTDRPWRILTPGMMATMDFNPKRLTIRLDHERRVTEAGCG